MTDIMKLVERLRNHADKFFRETDSRQLSEGAADAIEALQGEVEGLRKITLQKRIDAKYVACLEAERDALAAKLDELQRQDPIGEVAQGLGPRLYRIEDRTKWGMNLYAAPKALEPLTDAQSATLFQAVKDDPRSAKFSVQNWFTCGLVTGEAAHGITKGTP